MRPHATGELCADFAKLAPLAAAMPKKWCHASHPIGQAYQAACFVLDYAIPRGCGHEYVPAAYRVRNAIDAILAERDQRRHLNNHDASTVALLHALWIERYPLRRVAQKAGRHLKTIQERIQRALDALTAELGDAARHFNPGQFVFIDEKPIAYIFKGSRRPKPQLRTPPAELARPLSRVGMRRRIDRLVPRYLAKGGLIRLAPPGRTRDYKQAARVFNTGGYVVDPSGTPGEQGHLLYARQRTGTAPLLKPPGVPAKRLPQEIRDLKWLRGAVGHENEVWIYLLGGRFDEVRHAEEQADKDKAHELVEQFLDPQTRERRKDLEKELPTVSAGSSRAKRVRTFFAQAFVQHEMRRLTIIERGRERAAWVLELTQRRRLPSKPKPKPIRLKDLERADFLRDRRPAGGRNVKKGEAA